MTGKKKEEGKVDLYGKIAKFPKNTKAKSAFNFLENIRIPKKKLWYFIIEKENILNDDNVMEELQVIKYNNKEGVDCLKFVNSLKIHYSTNPELLEHVNQLVIEGSENFSTIRNIPDVEINGRKFINILSEDLIKLLHK